MNSEWVKTEIAKARRREKSEERRMLFPLSLVNFTEIEGWECFDADTGRDSAWKTDHDRYRQEFVRLLQALRDEAVRSK